MADEVVEEYRSSLDDLTFNSKPLISMLTMLADDHVQYAAEIVQVIEAHIQKAKATEKLPALYLLDSIIKNMSDSSYPRLFSQNLVSMFCGVFEKVDEKTRQAMWKLRQTWAEIIPNKRLYALDIRIQLIDPAWPITAQAPEEPVNIHVNPKFLIKQEQEEKAKKEQEEQEALMRQQLLAKQQELLKLQQERLELELAEAKARLVSQAKQIESQPPQLPGAQAAPAAPKAVVVPKVEQSDRSRSGSPVTIPTIAVQGIVRDPRSGARDPRLTRGGSASQSPTKEMTSSAAAPQAKKTTVSASKVLRSTPTGSPVPPDVAATPSESASKPRASSSSRSSGSSSAQRAGSRDKDDYSKDARSTRDKSGHAKSSSSSGSSSRKKLSPLKTRQGERRESEEGGRKAGPSSDRYSGGRTSKHSPSSSSSSSSSSSRSHRSHRQTSRSLSPEKDKKTSLPRSRSRSPRRSPRGAGLEGKDAGSRARGESASSSRDVDKRQRSPETDVVIVEHNAPSDTQPTEAADDLTEPPAKKSKPEEALPADFRELFGNEDQDYRCLPSTSFPKVPTTPPTPGTPSSGRWAQFKAERPQEFPFQQPRLTADMPSPGGQLQDVDMRSPPIRRMSAQSPSMPPPQLMSISPDQMNINIPAPLMLEQLDSVLTEADAQLRAGRLSHEQHQAILKQLGELQKLQQLKLQLQGQNPPSGDPPRPRDDPFQLGPERPEGGAAGERGSPRYDDPMEGFNRDGKDVDQRTQPPHCREPPPPMAPPLRPPVLGEFRPDEDLREKPQPPPMPMMRPPVPPPFLAGPGPRPRGPRPGFDRRMPHPVRHQSTGHFTLPYDTNQFYIPEHDPRWITQSNDANQHKLFIDDRAFELPLGCPPRHIVLGETRVQISVDTSSRGIKIDSICYYKIGDMPRKVTINGNNYLISYRGPEKKVWIDELAFEVHMDGPPEPILINGKEHSINIDSILNQVIIDNTVVCPFGGPQQQIDIGYEKHDIQFEPPQRKILIDGKLYEMNFTGKYPCVNTEGVDYGIRFDGPAREIIINNKPWRVEMEVPRKARFASGRIHVIGFGGPGHEVIINGQWYEVKFSGAEKTICLGNQIVKIRLEGPPPEVKILGQVVKDPMKIQELVGDAYIDPTLAVTTHPRNERVPQQFEQGSRMRMSGPDPGPRHMAPHGMGPQRMPEMGRGVPPHLRGPPRGGFHEGPQGPPPPPPRGVPQHMEERGRGSPQYEEPGGRNSPNHPDNFNNMHNMDMDRPPQPLPHRQDGPQPFYPQHGPPQQPFGRPGRGFRGGHQHRMRGGRGPRGMGRRDDFYQHGHPQGGGMRGMGPHRMQRPPNVPQLPQDNFNNNFFTPPPQQQQPQQQQQQQDPAYGAMPGMPQLPPTFATQIDINDLFGKLVTSGIIKKAEDPAPAPPPTTTTTTDTTPAAPNDTKPQQAATNVDQAKTENGDQQVAEKAAAPKPKPKEKLPEVPDLTDFNLDKMKTRHQTVVQRMYGGIQCSSCGVRFVTEDMDKYREHLDWHFRQNRRDKDGVKVAKFRQWYYTTNEWIQFEEIGDLEERAHSMYFERLLQTQALPGSTGAMQMPAAPISCPAATGNASEDVCEMCGEQFENFFDEDTEEWCLRDAIRVEDKTYHPACYEDVNESPMLETPTPEATEEEGETADPVSNPLAFLSMLTGGSPSSAADTTAVNTATTAVNTATDIKPEIKVETTTAPTVAVKTVDTAYVPPSEPLDVKPVTILPAIKTEVTHTEATNNGTTNKITTVGTGS